MSIAALLSLFLHCLLLSLLAVGGAIATLPELHRVVVEQHAWLSDVDFTASVALAQAAPGPNLLMVPVIGYNAGGLPGAMAAMLGMLLPSTALTLFVTRWGARRRDSRGVKAFIYGMAPVTLALLLATGWLLALPVLRGPSPHGWVAGGLVTATVLVMWRTKISPMWPIAVGAVVGAMGWV